MLFWLIAGAILTTGGVITASLGIGLFATSESFIDEDWDLDLETVMCAVIIAIGVSAAIGGGGMMIAQLN